jgi:hypothetical protein
MQTVEAAHDLLAIGQLAAHLQCSVRSIERAADKLRIVPALRLNLVPYFDADQVSTLTAELAHARPAVKR